MKLHTAILGLILLLMLGFVGFYFLGGTLVGTMTVETAQAADFPEAFERICEVLSGSGAPQVFDSTPLGDAARYRLVNLTVALRNRGMFDADWLHITLNPFPGDIAVYSLEGEGRDLGAGKRDQVSLKIITTAPADARRSVSIEYYVYGMKRSIIVEPGDE